MYTFGCNSKHLKRTSVCDLKVCIISRKERPLLISIEDHNVRRVRTKICVPVGLFVLQA